MPLTIAAASPLEGVGVVAATLAAFAPFVLRHPRARVFAMLGAAAITVALLFGGLLRSEQFKDTLDSPLVAPGAVAGIALMAGLAVLFLRNPAAFPLLAVAALPFRVPLVAGGQQANLLVPLYVVIGGGLIAYAWRRLRPGGQVPDGPGSAGRVSWLELLLPGAVVLYAVQASYSTDFDQALKNLVFFYVPFAVLLRLITEVEWTRAIALRCLAVVVGLALAFTGVGLYEYATKEVLLDPTSDAASSFQSYFRVSSLFFDPNAYGQFLSIVMLILATRLLWASVRRQALLAGGALAVLWVGLVLSFSQSSFAALLAGLVILAALRFGARPVGAVVAITAVVGVAAVLVFPGATGIDTGSDRATSGRSRLVTGGAEMFADRPVFGYGSGAFAERFRERETVSEFTASVSHTTPITVAAEQGVVGLVGYGLLLAAAGAVMFTGLGGLRRAVAPVPLVARGAVAAAFVALTVHTLFYGGFLENPLSWTLIGVALRLRAGAGGHAAEATGEDLAPMSVPATRTVPQSA